MAYQTRTATGALKRPNYALLAAGIEPPNKRSLAEESFPDMAPADSGLLPDEVLEILKGLGVPSGDEPGVEAGRENLLAPNAGVLGDLSPMGFVDGLSESDIQSSLDWLGVQFEAEPDATNTGVLSPMGFVDELSESDIQSSLDWLGVQFEANPESHTHPPLPGWDDVSASQ
jgi:hypothetical protein